MYEIEISKKELDTIVVALRDSEERLREQCKTLHCSYFDLPDNMLPASNLEGILGAIMAQKIAGGANYKKIGDFRELDILQIENKLN